MAWLRVSPQRRRALARVTERTIHQVRRCADDLAEGFASDAGGLWLGATERTIHQVGRCADGLAEGFAAAAGGPWLGATERMIHQVGRCADGLGRGFRRGAGGPWLGTTELAVRLVGRCGDGLAEGLPPAACGDGSGMRMYAFALGREHLGDHDRLRRPGARTVAGKLSRTGAGAALRSSPAGS